MGTPPIMMVPSSTMFGMTPYAPVNVYTEPPTAVVLPVTPNSIPNAEEELKQVSYRNNNSQFCVLRTTNIYKYHSFFVLQNSFTLYLLFADFRNVS